MVVEKPSFLRKLLLGRNAKVPSASSAFQGPFGWSSTHPSPAHPRHPPPAGPHTAPREGHPPPQPSLHNPAASFLKHRHPPTSPPPPALSFRAFASDLAEHLVRHPQGSLSRPATRLQRIISRLRAPRDPAAKTRFYYLLRRLERARSPAAHKLWLQTFLDRKRAALLLNQPEEELPPGFLMNIARDVVVCKGEDGSVHCTSFYVSFKPISTLYKWFLGKPSTPTATKASSSGVGSPLRQQQQQQAAKLQADHLAAASAAQGQDGCQPFEEAGVPPAHDQAVRQAPPGRSPDDEWVDVVVNGELVPQLQMVPDESGRCWFVATGTDSPSQEALAAMPLQPGKNPIQFIYRNPFGDVSTRASVHFWGPHDRVLVSDIDGTITKSDVIGYIDTVQLGKYDYTHAGICRLYTHLVETHQLRVVYLTSRPISMLEPTRAYLENCRQDGYALPPGPIFTSTGTLSQVLYKELIDKTIRYFKAHVLMDIATTFHKAGRRPDDAVFHLGFGNKHTDGEAYSAAGLHPNNIFIIDPYSEIRVYGHAAHGLGAGGGDDGWLALQEQLRQKEQEEEAKAAAANNASGSQQQQQQQPHASPVKKQGSAGSSPNRYARASQKAAAAAAASARACFDTYGDARLHELLRHRLLSGPEGSGSRLGREIPITTAKQPPEPERPSAEQPLG